MFPIFGTLSAPVANLLGEKLSVRQMDDGETLYMKGQPESFIALVVSGHIHIVLFGPNGRELIVDRLGQGQLVGETALIHPAQRATTAYCAGKTELLVLNKSNFPLLHSEPEFMRRLSHLVCERLRNSAKLLESVSLYRLESRLARYLLDKVGQISAHANNPVDIVIPTNQGHLAAMINVSRSKLNAQLQHWRRLGLIHWQRDSLRILDINRLRACAEADC